MSAGKYLYLDRDMEFVGDTPQTLSQPLADLLLCTVLAYQVPDQGYIRPETRISSSGFVRATTP